MLDRSSVFQQPEKREQERLLRPAALITAFAALLMLSVVVLAHGNEAQKAPADVWSEWSFEPAVVIALTSFSLLYFFGLAQLWKSAGRGNGLRRWEAIAGICGWLCLVVALVSPLHPLGSVLFSAHMTQHELLMLVAAPLLVLGRPAVVSMWALPLEWRKRVGEFTRLRTWKRTWRIFTNPFSAWMIHAAALWIWHVPFLFQATLNSESVHAAQHLSFLLSAVLFWWALIHGGRGLMGYEAGVLYVFTTSIHSGFLGVLLTFSKSLWYPAYADKAAWWGLSGLEDQQLGGLIMWIPAGLIYVVAGLALFAGWLREAERRAQLSASASLRPDSESGYGRESEVFL